MEAQQEVQSEAFQLVGPLLEAQLEVLLEVLQLGDPLLVEFQLEVPQLEVPQLEALVEQEELEAWTQTIQTVMSTVMQLEHVTMVSNPC